MIKDVNLRQLAQLASSERTFLSLYLTAPASLDRLNHRIQTIKSMLSGNPDELTEFEENLRLIRAYLEKKALPRSNLAMFSSWILNFFQTFTLELPVGDLIRVGPSPYIRPIAELQDEYETFAVVVADNEKSRIFLVSSVRAEEEEVIKGHIKNHVKVGGWSQQRYERRRDKSLHLYAGEVADRLSDLARDAAFQKIMLVGSQETMAEIAKALPHNLSDRLAGEKPLDLSRGDSYIHREIFELFSDLESRERIDLWQRIKGRYLRGELAAAGPADVLAAAKTGRVDRAIVNRLAEIPGTRCRDCDDVYAGKMDRCPGCGSTDIFRVDLVNEIVGRLALTSAEMEFADRIEELARVGDIAALLRY
jgi:peptide subunit release factor 1 (eRF1)